MDKIQKIIIALKKIPGLDNIIILSPEDKKYIKTIEDTNNQGVLQALMLPHTIACTHDSSFRKPMTDIVILKKGTLILPPVPFPEIHAAQVVSSSPNQTVDAYLKKKMKPKKDDATLIIGFD